MTKMTPSASIGLLATCGGTSAAHCTHAVCWTAQPPSRYPRRLIGARRGQSDTEDDMLGGYNPLFVFLNTRFADRVVLTFKEIEDLLGFTLPTAARTEAGWWTTSDSVVDVHAH